MSGAAYQHPQAKGLSCHLHANGVSGSNENGAGAGGCAVLLVEEVFEGPWSGTAQRIQPLGVENHLLVLIWSSQQVHLHTA